MKQKFCLLLLSVVFVTGCGSINRDTDCRNKQYRIAATLQSGEQGIVHITDNRCEFPSIHEKTDLSFSVVSDGAIQENIYESKMYIWPRDEQNPEAQIQSILKKRFPDQACTLERSSWPTSDNLPAYRSDCLFFSSSDISSETFIVVNNLIVLYRQDGIDGIPPFNVASVAFVKN